ncbi:hypothetical protein A6R68_19344, partial [Neotoma lepida]
MPEDSGLHGTLDRAPRSDGMLKEGPWSRTSDQPNLFYEKLKMEHKHCKLTYVHVPTGSKREPASPQNFLTKMHVKQNMERLTSQLQQMTIERNEQSRNSDQPNPFYEKLKMEHKHVMRLLEQPEVSR